MTADQAVLVTGASRGPEREFRWHCRVPGSVIYITSRTLQEGDAELPDSLASTSNSTRKLSR